MKKLQIQLYTTTPYFRGCGSQLITFYPSVGYNFELPKKLFGRKDLSNKLQFTIGINTKNPGFWVHNINNELYVFESYKDFKSGLYLDSYCGDGIKRVFGEKFPFELFKKPVKVGVRAV